MRPAPRIAIVSWGDLAFRNNILTLTNFLAEQHFGVALFALDAPPGRPARLSPEVDLHPLPFGRPDLKGWRKHIGAARRLRAALAGRTVDVTYVIHNWTLPTVWIATRGRFAWGRSRFVYHTFDWLEPALVTPWHLWLERAACRRAHLVVNVDRSRARLQRTLYRLKVTPLSVPNYPSRMFPAAPRDESLRRALVGSDAPSDAVLVVCPALASPERLTRQLIEAFALLPDRYRLVTFTSQDAYSAACQERGQELGVASRVQILAAEPYDRLVHLVACADIGAVFHDAEASSGYFMANADRLGLFACHGVPFVASNTPNMEAVVYRNRLGLCCDPYDPADIARTIVELAENPPGLAARSSLVRDAFDRTLHFEAHAGPLAERLRSLAERQ